MRIIAAAIKELVAECPAPQKLGMTGIFIKESGLPMEEWFSRDTTPRPAEMGKWSRLPNRREWDLLSHLFGIRSKDDLERVLSLADLGMRIDKVIPDRARERLDLAVRRLARKESPSPSDVPYRPPNRTQALTPLVYLVNVAPAYLSRWYVSRLLSELHLLAWEGSSREKKRARDLGVRLGKAVTQPLGRGRRRAFSLDVFRHTAALYDKLKGDAFTFAKQYASAREAEAALRREHPHVPDDHVRLLVSVGRSPRINKPRKLFLAALRRRFSIHSDRHVYRLLPTKN